MFHSFLNFGLRRDDRVADCAALEMLCTARYRGFESLSLRHFQRRPIGRLFFCVKMKNLTARPLFFGSLRFWNYENREKHVFSPEAETSALRLRTAHCRRHFVRFCGGYRHRINDFLAEMEMRFESGTRNFYRDLCAVLARTRALNVRK